jgi:hypothetical protein
MSNTKTVMSQAANTLVKPLEVEDVFSTYLYPSSNEVDKPVANGIDLDGEGGLVWIKTRSVSNNHYLYDTVRGSSVGDDKGLKSNSTAAEASGANLDYLQFNSDGFTAKHVTGGGALGTNTYYGDMASWTFRKAPKFFDVVTWTGDGTTGRAISHNLGCEVGAIFVKTTSGSSNWYVYNRNLTSANYGLKLNGTDAEAFWGTGNVTDTTFSFDHQNGSGNTYVAYLFAHNDGDGGFNGGDIIKCGSYTGNQNVDGPEIDLGFEPQFVLVKLASSAGGNWVMADTMRGFVNNPSINQIYANTSDAEQAVPVSQANPTATGFKVTATGGNWNSNGQTYIYIAIRRGTKVPESATEVFDVDLSGGTAPRFESSFPVDMAFWRPTVVSNTKIASRLTGNKSLLTNDTSLEDSAAANVWDFMDGFYDGGITSNYAWMWKRAPGFFDAVAYTGDGVRGRTISHNLGVVPEMMWIKNRDDSQNWLVYVHSLGGTKKLYLNSLTSTLVASIDDFNNTDAEATQFTVGNDGRCNANNQDFVAYLFASLDGVSKVGSYTGNGTSQTIDCGFTSGARFVLIKRTDTSDNWHVWDTERGIVAGNDPYLLLDSTQQEVTSTDNIDPDNSGFIVSGSMNVSSGEYIFYAIA